MKIEEPGTFQTRQIDLQADSAGKRPNYAGTSVARGQDSLFSHRP